jgi:hypothetical protein
MKATTPRLVIENQNFASLNLEGCIKDDMELTVNEIRNRFPSFKCGRGGSHVWVSTCDNERIAVIYYE